MTNNILSPKSNNLKFDLVMQNQAQKEVTINQALTSIDAILNNAAIDIGADNCPSSANNGDIYVLGDNPTASWTGHAKEIAYYNEGWYFIIPNTGMSLWVKSQNKHYIFNQGVWEALNVSESAYLSINNPANYQILQHDGTNFVNQNHLSQIAKIGINTGSDDYNKLAVRSDAILFTSNNGDVRINANKNSDNNTASHLFQNNYSGRAEFGLIGSDNFTLKTSADGSQWHEAFVVDKNTGNIDFKANITRNGVNIDYIEQESDVGNNLITNGCCRVAQRINHPLIKDIWGFGKTDRFAAMATGDAVTTGIFTNALENNISYAKFDMVSISANGYIFMRTRIESKDASLIANQYASFLALVKHDVGANVNYEIFIRKANAIDDFSSTTLIGSHLVTTQPIAGEQEIKFENIYMGDCSTGIEIEIKIHAGSIYAKSFYFRNLQLNRGAVASKFILENFALTLKKCERYFEKSYELEISQGTASDEGLCGGNNYTDGINKTIVPILFATRKRARPTIYLWDRLGNAGKHTDYKNGNFVNDNVYDVSLALFNTRSFMIASSSPMPNCVLCHYIADAEM